MYTVENLDWYLQQATEFKEFVSTCEHFPKGTYLYRNFDTTGEHPAIYLVQQNRLFAYGEFGDVEGKKFRLVTQMDMVLSLDNWSSSDIQIDSERLYLYRPLEFGDLIQFLTSPDENVRQVAESIGRRLNAVRTNV